MNSVRIQDRPIPRCPFCHENVSGGAQYQCEQCGADHHLACWHEKDGCSACDEGRTTRKPGELRWKHDPRTGGDYAEVPADWRGGPLIRPEGAKGWIDHGRGVFTGPATVIDHNSSESIVPVRQESMWRKTTQNVIWVSMGVCPILVVTTLFSTALVIASLAGVLAITLFLSNWISPPNQVLPSQQAEN